MNPIDSLIAGVFFIIALGMICLTFTTCVNQDREDALLKCQAKLEAMKETTK